MYKIMIVYWNKTSISRLVNRLVGAQYEIVNMRVNDEVSGQEGINTKAVLSNLGIEYRKLGRRDGHHVISKTSEWYKHFKDGQMFNSDDPGYGCSQPTEVIAVNIQHVEHLVLDNQHITCFDIAQMFLLEWSAQCIIIMCHANKRRRSRMVRHLT